MALGCQSVGPNSQIGEGGAQLWRRLDTQRAAQFEQPGREPVQVLDPAERTLIFDGPRLFEDLESGQKIYSDPDSVRSEYLRKLNAHNKALQAVCDAVGASFRQLTTNEPLELALAEFLQARRQRSAR